MKKYKVTINVKTSAGMETKEVEFGGETSGEAIGNAFKVAWSIKSDLEGEIPTIIKLEEIE